MHAKTRRRVNPSSDGVVTRLPEIKSIDGDIRNEVLRVFKEEIPEYFWLVRSSEEYHPPDQRSLCGLWIHTKRVYTVYRMLERSYRAMNAIGAYQANCARAAVLLHDGFKYGRDPDENDEDYHAYADGLLAHLPEHTQPDHDIRMAEFVRDETSLPDEVASYIESHGGPTAWYSHEGPSPSNDPEMVVHTADCIASNQHHRIPVWKPSNELQTLIGDDIPSVDADEWELTEADVA